MPDNFTISLLGTDQQNVIFTGITIAEFTDATDEPVLPVLRLGASWSSDDTPAAAQKPAVSPARVKVATSKLRVPPADVRRRDKQYRRLCAQLRGEYDVRTPSEIDALEALASDLMWRGQLQAAVCCLDRSVPELGDVPLETLVRWQVDYENARRIRRALAVLEGNSDKPLSKACLRRVAGLAQQSVNALADRGAWEKMDWLEQLRYAQDDGLWDQLKPYHRELGSRDWVSGVLRGALQISDGQKRALMTLLQQRGELHRNWATFNEAERQIMEHSKQSLAELVRNGDLSKFDRHLSAVNQRIAKQRKDLESCRRGVPGWRDRRC